MIARESRDGSDGDNERTELCDTRVCSMLIQEVLHCQVASARAPGETLHSRCSDEETYMESLLTEA